MNPYIKLLDLLLVDREKEEKLIFACNTFGINKSDVEFSVTTFIPNNYNIKYTGIRLALGAFLNEFIEISRLREYKKQGKKLLYGAMPARPTLYSCFCDATASFPDYMLILCLNLLFANNTLLDISEKYGLNKHCAINKLRYSIIKSEKIPVPDVMWNWGFGCDESPKIDEVLEINTVRGGIPRGEENIAFMAKTLEEGFYEVKKILKVNTSFDKADIFSVYGMKIKWLQDIVLNSNPQIISGNELQLFWVPMHCAFILGFEHIGRAIDTMLQEAKIAKDRKQGYIGKNALKIGGYYMPYTIPGLNEIFKRYNIATTFSLANTIEVSKAEKNENIFYKTARQWYSVSDTQNFNIKIERMAKQIEKYSPDAVIVGFFDFDKWVGATQRVLKDSLSKKTNIPHFYFQGDFFDLRKNDMSKLEMQIETIASILKEKTETKKCLEENSNE